MPITPKITDVVLNDLNGNARYEPKKGESYNDINDNGMFDPIWIGGFHNSRPAQGVHDDHGWVMGDIIGETRLLL